MFQLTSVKTRYFEFQAPDNRKVLHIEPPKLKTMNRLNKMAKAEDPGVDDMAEVVARIIGKNKEGRRITAETVMDWMDSDQLAAFISAFLSWLNKTKENDPN